MGATRSLIGFVKEELHFLIYTVLEWMLIGILYLNEFLTFVANEFAFFFHLKIPCLLCSSKSDRVMLHKDSNCYCNNSICEFHKKCLSSIAYCHNHKKLSDIRNMCEGCLLSFVMEKESSDCDTYKSLVGILHKDLEFFVGKDIEIHLGLSNDYVYEETSKSQKCYCCGQPLKVKKFIRSKARKNAVKKIPKAPGPVPLLKVNSREKRKELSKSESDYSELEEDDNISNKTTTLEDLAPNSPRCYYRTNMESTTEKTGLAPENSEASVSKEAGEAMLNLSSRQVHLDRKPLMALYMELDEERNASAVAANNAMAMIMRLQAEKAEIQMEALQYQRLMEEEVEHDEESLRKTKEMLLKKEEEVMELENELTIYRENYGSLMSDEETRKWE